MTHFRSHASPSSSLRLLTVALALIGTSALAGPLDAGELATLLDKMDVARFGGADSKSLMEIEETFQKLKVVREGLAYVKADDTSMTMVLTKPKTEAGAGYLLVDRNLWSYDPKLGKWERRTEREKLYGMNVRRSDIRMGDMRKSFNATDAGEETLGGLKLRKLRLQAKEGIEVAFPESQVWVDDGGRVVKTQDFGAGGKLMRTTVISKRSKIKDQFFPTEIQIIDEVEKGRKTVIKVKKFEINPVDANVFTKAWLEGQSR